MRIIRRIAACEKQYIIGFGWLGLNKQPGTTTFEHVGERK